MDDSIVVFSTIESSKQSSPIGVDDGAREVTNEDTSHFPYQAVIDLPRLDSRAHH
jgi:hypothetical protein